MPGYLQPLAALRALLDDAVAGLESLVQVLVHLWKPEVQTVLLDEGVYVEVSVAVSQGVVAVAPVPQFPVPAQ